MQLWTTLVRVLERHDRAVVVTVAAAVGSTPREAGARLVVVPGGGFHGTIGGGTLEWQALARAQAMLDSGDGLAVRAVSLGPELGQCCGGRVTLVLELFNVDRLQEARDFAEREATGPFVTMGAADGGHVARRIVEDQEPPAGIHWHNRTLIERFGVRPRPLLLCGAGHVGRALVLALAPLPFAVRWVDPRPDAFPGAVPGNVEAEAADPVAAVEKAEEGTFVLVMTHSHSLDLAVVDAALRSDCFAYVGLIGSATKRARLTKRLREAGLSETQLNNLSCPIGFGGIRSKMPAIIAASVAADLLMRDEQAKTDSVGTIAMRGTK